MHWGALLSIALIVFQHPSGQSIDFNLAFIILLYQS